MATGRFPYIHGYNATEVHNTLNSDGTVTYSAVIPDLDVVWTDGAGDHNCTAVVTVSVTAPSGVAEPGPGGFFRFDTNGGYNVHITGTDWTD
jgi:hypothetical protein